ncbi:MAG TPA: hypothetical protein VIH57_04230 [Bacteroidales bacterium]
MKIVKFFSVALVSSLLLASSVLANDVVKKEGRSDENAVRRQLAGVLSKVSTDSNSEVFVYFKLSSKDGFELIDVKGQDNDLASKVKSALSTGAIAAPASLDGKYLVKVKFTSYDSL